MVVFDGIEQFDSNLISCGVCKVFKMEYRKVLITFPPGFMPQPKVVRVEVKLIFVHTWTFLVRNEPF